MNEKYCVECGKIISRRRRRKYKTVLTCSIPCSIKRMDRAYFGRRK
jgi:RNA polymerase-binding transcription factor DksA